MTTKHTVQVTLTTEAVRPHLARYLKRVAREEKLTCIDVRLVAVTTTAGKSTTRRAGPGGVGGGESLQTSACRPRLFRRRFFTNPGVIRNPET